MCEMGGGFRVRQEKQPTDDRTKDVLASMPPAGGTPENDHGSLRTDARSPRRDQPLGDIAALAHTLVAQLPVESAALRALAVCARLLPGSRSLRLFELRGGGTEHLTLLGEVTRTDSTGRYRSLNATQDVATLGLGDEADVLVLRGRQEYRKEHKNGSTHALPLLAASGALLGAFVLEHDPQARSDAPLLGICADTLAVLLERLWHSRLEQRAQRALETASALMAPENKQIDDLDISRQALDVLAELAEPMAALLLAPGDDGTLQVPRADGRPVPLDSTRSAELLGALREQREIVISAEENADLWRGLAMLREQAREIADAEPACFTLLPVMDDSAVVAVLALASGATTAESGDWLPTARIVIAAAEAGVRTLRLRQQVAAQGKARDEYISLAGHELRSPLTSIKGYAQLLARQSRKTTLPESMVRSVEAIEQQSQRMSEMIGELLDASRIQRNRLEISLARTDLVPIAVKVVERRRKFHPQHLIELKIEAETLIGNWDALRVEQILRDLLDNAARFSPEGGVITVGLTGKNGDAQVRVLDYGIGVPDEDRERIFEYLYRAPSAQRRNLTGLGLGLYICRNLAERMGGRLVLRETHADEGSGSVFELSLPLV